MHITTNPFSTHHTFSILSVLPQCDSAMNVLSIHPFLITLLLNQLSKRSHTTVLRFHSSFWICWSECEQRCLNRNESLFASILSRKWSAHHPMDCERVWLHSTRDSQHLTEALAICDVRRKHGIFAFINFTLWTQSILLVYRTLQPGRSWDESDAGAECDECGERNEHGEGRKSNSEDGRLRWIDDVCWKMFKVSHLREIGRTNNSSCRY